MSFSSKIKNILNQIDSDYLLVNNTNEWLDETPNILESSVYTLTGFTGDTGDVLMCKNGDCYLFVDGRYHIQAENEVKKEIKIVKLQPTQRQDIKICKMIKENNTLAITTKKISLGRFEKLKQQLENKNIKFKFLDKDLINDNSIKKSDNFLRTGCAPKKLNNTKSILITEPNKVSYLTQYRNFEQEGSSKIYAKLFIDKDGEKKFFTNQQEMEEFLKNYNEEIIVNKDINLYDYNLLKYPVIEDDKINILKSVKTEEEINALKNAFKISDKSLLQLREFILNSKSGELSEFDISNKLTELFFQNGATGLSFKPIVAINQHSSLAHYNDFSKTTYLKDGNLLLIDCGIYTKEGLATDTTRVFVKGEPSELQKQVYTLVLKAFLNCYNMHNSTGFEMHSCAHQILDNQIYFNNRITEFVFNHGLGHGIGITVHEAPPSLSIGEIAKKNIENGMCFTIEPGLYHRDYFGIRLENSFYMENNKNISFNSIGFEKKLIEFDKLNENEKQILQNFELLD